MVLQKGGIKNFGHNIAASLLVSRSGSVDVILVTFVFENVLMYIFIYDAMKGINTRKQGLGVLS